MVNFPKWIRTAQRNSPYGLMHRSFFARFGNPQSLVTNVQHMYQPGSTFSISNSFLSNRFLTGRGMYLMLKPAVSKSNGSSYRLSRRKQYAVCCSSCTPLHRGTSANNDRTCHCKICQFVNVVHTTERERNSSREYFSGPLMVVPVRW